MPSINPSRYRLCEVLSCSFAVRAGRHKLYLVPVMKVVFVRLVSSVVSGVHRKWEQYLEEVLSSVFETFLFIFCYHLSCPGNTSWSLYLAAEIYTAGGARDRAFDPWRFPAAERFHGLRFHVPALQVARHAQGTTAVSMVWVLCLFRVPCDFAGSSLPRYLSDFVRCDFSDAWKCEVPEKKRSCDTGVVVFSQVNLFFNTTSLKLFVSSVLSCFIAYQFFVHVSHDLYYFSSL